VGGVVEGRLGDDGIKVWFNGIEVVSRDIERGMKMDQEKVAVTFKRGLNRLLIRIDNRALGGGFLLRITDENGKPVIANDKGELPRG
jgi:hypothetical protein